MKTVKEIADENDFLRRTFMGGKVLMTPGVSHCTYKEEILLAVREFNNFHKGNDPYGEHDCAVFEVHGQKFIFKIDYYDKNYEYGVDPKEEKCSRVMTIMRSDEY